MIFQKVSFQTKVQVSDAVKVVFVLFVSVVAQLVSDAKPQAAAHKVQQSAPAARQMESITKLINSNKFSEAAALSRELLKGYPQNAELLSNVALASLYSGDMKSAEVYAEKTLKLDSQNHEAHWVLTNVYSTQGKLEASTRELGLSMKYRSTKPCKPCKHSKKNLDLLKSIQQSR